MSLVRGEHHFSLSGSVHPLYILTIMACFSVEISIIDGIIFLEVIFVESVNNTEKIILANHCT